MFYQFGFSLYLYSAHILFVYKLVLVILNWGSKHSLVFYTLFELSICTGVVLREASSRERVMRELRNSLCKF